MATVMVTNMPFWSERVGAPRSLAVEFPFGHIVGRPHDTQLQRRVVLRALQVLEEATEPGTIVHFPEPWPEPLEAGLRASHPDAPPPITAAMGRHMGRLLMGMRRGRS